MSDVKKHRVTVNLNNNSIKGDPVTAKPGEKIVWKFIGAGNKGVIVDFKSKSNLPVEFCCDDEEKVKVDWQRGRACCMKDKLRAVVIAVADGTNYEYETGIDGEKPIDPTVRVRY